MEVEIYFFMLVCVHNNFLPPKLFWRVFCSFLKFEQPIMVGVLMLNF